MKRVKKNETAKLDGHRLDLLRSLIANLFVDEYQAASGMVSRIPEMGKYRIEPEMLSDDLKFEKAVLGALKQAREEKLVASQANIKNLLVAQGIKENLNDLLRNRTEDPDVYSLAVALGDWIAVQRQISRLVNDLKKAQVQYITTQEFYQMMVRAITDTAPPRNASNQRTTEEAWNEWERNRIETAKIIRAGGHAGPTFPWKDLREKIPALKPGWLVSILAKTGHGKTTIAVILAMYWAYTQGYDVYYAHLETGIVDMIDRIIASELLIPADAWDTGRAMLDEDKFWSAYQAKKAEILEKEATMGHIEYDHCPGTSIEDFRMKVAEQRVKADLRGRELIVIVDYYTEFDKTEIRASNEAAQNNYLADQLKSIAETDETNCIMVALAQFDPDAKYDEKSKSWNGGKIFMRSQAYIRMERDMANKPIGWTDSETKTQKVNFFNEPILLQNVGDWSAITKLNVLKCNQGKTGITQVVLVNGYFKILELPTQITK